MLAGFASHIAILGVMGDHEMTPIEVVQAAVRALTEQDKPVNYETLRDAVAPTMKRWLEDREDDALQLQRLVQEWASDS